jgi:hypothetical protein
MERCGTATGVLTHISLIDSSSIAFSDQLDMRHGPSTTCGQLRSSEAGTQSVKRLSGFPPCHDDPRMPAGARLLADAPRRHRGRYDYEPRDEGVGVPHLARAQLVSSQTEWPEPTPPSATTAGRPVRVSRIHDSDPWVFEHYPAAEGTHHWARQAEQLEWAHPVDLRPKLDPVRRQCFVTAMSPTMPAV